MSNLLQSKLMNHWEKIFDNLTLPTTTVCYIGIGSAMGGYTEITEENNQQYPCFLENFTGKHLVILIDPLMETDLKLASYFAQSDPLVLVNENTSQYVREYTNEKGMYFIINDSFYINIHQYMDASQVEKVNQNIAILYQLISIALGKFQPSKIIYQDYTGCDTTNFYISLFDIFDRDDIFDRNMLIKNVSFDVTQLDGGCFISFKRDMIELDDQQNFIQEKYEQLIKFSHSPKYYNIIKTRIDTVSYPLVWNYIKLKESKDFEQVGLDKVKILAAIYQVDFDISSKNYELIMSRYNQLIEIVIRDIVMSRNIDDGFVEYLLTNLENRTEFTNLMSVLKYE